MTAVGRSPGTHGLGAPLEREHELREAGHLLADIRDDRGRLLLLAAPPGLGKSMVARAVMARAAADGVRVGRAAGRELEHGLGWGVARSLFEPWLFSLSAAERDEVLSGPSASARPLFDAELAGTGERPVSEVGFGVLHGLYWLAVRLAERGPLLLVIDDAHWADEPSLRFVAYLLGRLAEQPIGLLVTARSGEPGAGGLLARIAAAPETTVCELAPLGPGAVATIVRERVPGADDAFCRRCWELTAGNPLGIRELVSAIAEEAAAPDLDAVAERAARSLSRSVLMRLGGLSRDARGVAEAVAVFEGEAEVTRVAALAGLDTAAALAAADALSRVDILLPDDPLSFTHPLLRAAVYGSLSRRRKAEAHRRAADVLCAARAPDEQVATHLLATPPAGDEAVVECLRRAARRAIAHGVPSSAITYLDRALREPPTSTAVLGVLAELGGAEATVAPHDAIAHLERAIELAPDRTARVALAIELGRALHDAGRSEDACAAFERGAAELGAAAGEQSSELKAWYVTAAVMLPERARDAHRRAAAIRVRPVRSASPAERGLMSKTLIGVYDGAPCEPLAALAWELFTDGRLIEDDATFVQAVGHVVAALSFSDRYADAAEVLARAEKKARRAGWLTWFASMLQFRTRQRLWTGPIPDALTEAATAFEIYASGMQMYLPAAAAFLARCHLERGEVDEAGDALARAESGPVPRGMFAAWMHEARGRLAAHRGEYDRALEAFLACGECASSVLVVNPAMFPWRSEAGLAALRLGQRERAAELIGEERERAARFGAPRAIGVAARAAALLQPAAETVPQLRAAAATFAQCGASLEHARTLVELGAAIRRDGRPTEARTMLRDALGRATAVGALAIADRARAELERAGARSVARGETAGELTPSEQRVAQLAAVGRTNREIANELFVTVKAVEWHLGNAYRKLDIRGRAQLAAALGLDSGASRPAAPR